MVGKPLIYNTSKNFMDYLGINAASQLPQIKDITDIQIVMPTNAEGAAPVEAQLIPVSEHTELKQAS